MPDRCLIIGHYAGHGSLMYDNLYFVAGPSSNQRFAYERSLASLMDPGEVLPNTDCILILDSCFSGTATRGRNPCDWSDELVVSVGLAQKALGN